MRKLFAFVVVLVMLFSLSACNREQHPLVGLWESEHNVLSFNDDGTGFEQVDGQVFEFLWNASEGILTFDFLADANGSLISHFMSHIIHGSPVESFGYVISADGEEFTISDDHGHGHFRIVLRRA